MTKRDSIASKAIYSCKEQEIMESQDRQHYEGTLYLISNFPISTYVGLFADQRKFRFTTIRTTFLFFFRGQSEHQFSDDS